MFTLKQAIGYARRLPRFRYQSLRPLHPRGGFVPQLAIPLAMPDYCKIAERIMINRAYVIKTLWVRTSLIRSEQISLRRDKLIKHLKRYASIQRKHRPVVVMVRGTPTVWDGNHRVTAARLLGKKFIRCRVISEK